MEKQVLVVIVDIKEIQVMLWESKLRIDSNLTQNVKKVMQK